MSHVDPGGQARAELVAALLELQDAVARLPAEPPAAVRDVTAGLRAAGALLAAHATTPAPAAGDLVMLDSGLVPRYGVDVVADGRLEGRVTLTAFHLGSGVAHGGVVPLLLDDVLGRLVHSSGLPPARTAMLQVDFRAVTPVDVELTVRARVDRVDGRKRYVSAELVDPDGTVTAEVRGLWVELRRPQP